MKRTPRASYREQRYPPWTMDRRGFLRRLGGAGGLLLLGASPMGGRALAEVMGTEDVDVHVVWLPWSHGSRSVDTESGRIDYQLEIGVRATATAVCLQEVAVPLLEDVDAMLADRYCKLPLYESGNFTDYPLLVELVTSHCPAPADDGGADDDSAGEVSEPSDEDGYVYLTLWWYAQQRFIAGIPANPDCLCRVPTRRPPR